VRTSARSVTGPPPGSQRFRSIATWAALLVALVVVLASCSGGSSSSESEKKSDSSSKSGATTTSSGSGASAQQAAVQPDGPQAAIASYLQGQGIAYVGDCADAQQPRDDGKWCSTLVAGDATSDSQTYDLGPVGEKPQKSITLQRRGETHLTPGFQVDVADGNVGAPSELTREQLQSDVFITGNLQLDQAAGIGNGLGDLPPGSDSGTGGGGTGGTGGGTGGGGATPPIVVTPGGGGTGQYPPQGEIVVENPVVQVGGEAFFRGGGCEANEPLTISFDGHQIGTIAADPSGNFAGSISIPKGTAPGAHLLTVRGSQCVLNATITVAGNLAFTGASNHTTTYVLAGMAAVVVGLVLVVGTRRRVHGVRGRRSP
jgi:hypothetical protein